MKNLYRRPTVIEFGRIDQLTLGSGGAKPDFRFDSGTGGLKLVNTNCDASPPAYACLIRS